MHVFWSGRWSALVVAFGLVAQAAHADLITPDSIPNPPTPVASAQGTPLFANNVVLPTQYAAVGLDFSRATAITRLNGVSVWAPIGVAVGGATAVIDYVHTLSGSMVTRGSVNSRTVSSLSIDIVGLAGTPSLGVYGLNGQPLNIIPVLQSKPGPDGGQVWTFTGSGLSAFWVEPPAQSNSAWGISEVSFTTASTPEPSSFLLAGLGALGMTARFGWRRVRLNGLL